MNEAIRRKCNQLIRQHTTQQGSRVEWHKRSLHILPFLTKPEKLCILTKLQTNRNYKSISFMLINNMSVLLCLKNNYAEIIDYNFHFNVNQLYGHFWTLQRSIKLFIAYDLIDKVIKGSNVILALLLCCIPNIIFNGFEY